MKKIALFTNIALLFAMHATAQNGLRRVDFDLNLGLNIGATAPLPLPAEVRKIEHYNPKINPHLGISMTYSLDAEKKWGIAAEAAFDAKGMRVKDKVKYMHTEVTVSHKDDPDKKTVAGDFVGKNMTNVNLHYLTLSVYGVYNINEKWSLKAGPYLASTLKSRFDGNVSDGYLLDANGERFNIDDATDATFDFRDDIRDFDIGLLVGGKLNVNRQIGVTVGLTWGLNDVFYSGSNPISFKMQNIYGTIGVSYRLNN